MVKSNANYSNLPEEYNHSTHGYPTLYDQPQQHLPQDHTTGVYEYPTGYQQPHPHLPQTDRQLLSPASNTTEILLL